MENSIDMVRLRTSSALVVVLGVGLFGCSAPSGGGGPGDASAAVGQTSPSGASAAESLTSMDSSVSGCEVELAFDRVASGFEREQGLLWPTLTVRATGNTARVVDVEVTYRPDPRSASLTTISRDVFIPVTDRPWRPVGLPMFDDSPGGVEIAGEAAADIGRYTANVTRCRPASGASVDVELVGDLGADGKALRKAVAEACRTADDIWVIAGSGVDAALLPLTTSESPSMEMDCGQGTDGQTSLRIAQAYGGQKVQVLSVQPKSTCDVQVTSQAVMNGQYNGSWPRLVAMISNKSGTAVAATIEIREGGLVPEGSGPIARWENVFIPTGNGPWVSPMTGAWWSLDLPRLRTEFDPSVELSIWDQWLTITDCIPVDSGEIWRNGAFGGPDNPFDSDNPFDAWAESILIPICERGDGDVVLIEHDDLSSSEDVVAVGTRRSVKDKGDRVEQCRESLRSLGRRPPITVYWFGQE